MPYTIIFLIVLAVLFLASAIRILNEYERGVIFRLGRVMSRAKGPGLIILIPVVDRMVKISLRLVAMDVPPQDVITRDGGAELDELLSDREKINSQLQEILDKHTDPWGVKVTTVEVKHIDLPQDMQRAMARQAEAERERRAKVINAEGEHQAAARLAQAAAIISEHPIALQLRYLQTLREVSAENNSTTLFPIPIDLFKPFLKLQEIVEKSEKEGSST
ncbi:MAG: SPFH domain-containing protein [Syntrophobacterales bacterium]